MTELLTREPDTTEIQKQAHAMVVEANSILIDDPASYMAAGAYLTRMVKPYRQRVADTFGEPVRRAHETHKAILAAKKKHDQPASEAEQIVKGKMSVYQREEEAKRQAEEDRLREQARKAEEERRLAEAERLEREGHKEAADEVIEAPIVTPPIVLPKQTPKVEGISTRKVWKFRVVNMDLVPSKYLMVDVTVLGMYARAMKDQARVPGVEFYSEDVVSARAV